MDRARGEQIFVIVLCILASARVFAYSAAFPFFNNVDEQMHFDLVTKYSVADVPKEELSNYSRRAAELIVLYGTPEYFHGPASFPNGRIPSPVWKIPNVRSTQEFERAVAHWQQRGNHESASFPAYYAIAGLWSAAGRSAGLSGGTFLYWIRFLNVPLFAALVYLSYLIGRTLARRQSRATARLAHSDRLLPAGCVLLNQQRRPFPSPLCRLTLYAPSALFREQNPSLPCPGRIGSGRVLSREGIESGCAGVAWLDRHTQGQAPAHGRPGAGNTFRGCGS